MANIRLNNWSNESNESSKNGNNGGNNDWYEEFVCKALPERMRCCRKYWGWNQEELAERSELSVTAYGQIERGKSVAQVETLRKIELALNVPEGFLYADAQKAADNGKIKSEKKSWLIKKLMKRIFL